MTVEQLISIHAEANDLLKRYGLTEQGWIFQLSDHKRIVGQCSHTDKVIRFSKYYLQSPAELITDTLLHEIAHALVGPGHGHGRAWRNKAALIGAKPERCAAPEAKTTVRHNYKLVCPHPDCDKVWYRHRLKESARRGKCPVHLEQLKIYKLIYK